MIFDDELTRFIHEPARLVLMTNLAAVGKADFVFLLNATGLTRGNLSVQMSRLHEKELVTVEKTIRDNRPSTTYQITRLGRSVLKRYKRSMMDLLEFLSV